MFKGRSIAKSGYGAMNSEDTGEIMWVRMKHGVWWPTEEAKEDHSGGFEDEFSQSSPRLARVAVLGLNIELTVDMKDTSSIRHVAAHDPSFDDLCLRQSVPDHFRERFALSLAAIPSRPAMPVPTAQIIIKKRADVLSWDDYFMSVAFLSSLRSKDPSTQVGACIVNPDQRIVGIGYNGKSFPSELFFCLTLTLLLGFPRGCSDDLLPWAREADDPLDTKYPVRKPRIICPCINYIMACISIF